jgi:lysophospholipase L1-like esterase
VRKHFLTVALGVLVGLLVVEVALRVASSVVTRVALRGGGAAASDGDKFRIFCIGDSNTYGAGVPRDQSYPAQLEKVLNAAAGEERFDVVNLGVPGSNSAQALHRLPKYLRAYKPHLVIVLAGVNDYWNPAEVDDQGERTFGERLNRLLLHLRTYRLAVLVIDYFRWGAAGGITDATLKTTQLRKDAAKKATADATIHELKVGDETVTFRNPRRALLLDDAQHQELLRKNLDGIIEVARASGVPLVLPTYIADLGHYSTANAVILERRDDAAVTQLQLRDLLARTPSLAEAKEKFFPDLHPKGPVYSAYALSLCDELVKRKLVPLASCDPATGAPPTAASPAA